MNGPEILHLIRTDLQRALSRYGEPPKPEPIDCSPWVSMSLVQKSTRRGREALALRAAATLLREAPDRLWRRCACIAAENVGLASLETMGIVTAALAGKKFRADLGGEWRIACCIISELCRAAQSGDREQPFHGIVSAHST